MKTLLISFFSGYNHFVLVYFLVINAIYGLLTAVSFFAIRRHLQRSVLSHRFKWLFRNSFYKPISVLAPAYNEEATIADSVKSLLQLHYPEFEIIVINDGSKDATMAVLEREFQLKPSGRPFRLFIPCAAIRGVYASETHPRLVVVDKENGRKADALNAGINIAQFPIVCSIDADSVLEATVLSKLVEPFLDAPETVAVGGIVRVANGCTVHAGEIVEIALPPTWLPRFQIVEYLGFFVVGRVGWDALNGLLVISGAFGMFRKDAVLACGGYRHDTVGEDMELVVRLHRWYRDHHTPYRITFVAEPVCWTEVPETMAVLARQRNRWQRGLIETIRTHKGMLFNPRYGIVGMLAMPFFLIFELFGPVVEFTGYIIFFASCALGIVNLPFAILFLSASVLLGIVLSVSSLVLEELSFRKYPRFKQILILFAVSILENFGYRQIHTWWRFRGIVDYLRGVTSWGAMQRTGMKKRA